MACHRRLVLPPLKLTKRSTSGEVTEKRITRGISVNASRDEGHSRHSVNEDDPADYAMYSDDDNCLRACEDSPGPGLYQISQKVSVAAWQSIRQNILKTVTESNAMPSNQVCTCCCMDLAMFKCFMCGPCTYFCGSCLEKQHTNSNIFHLPLQWKDGRYVSITLDNRSIDVTDHTCSTKREVSICCVDEYGMEHKISFSFCQCEPLALTLIRARLWPATVQNPRLAFTFDLLDWAEALMYECQVAVKNLWGALQYKTAHLHRKRRNIYPSFIDSFEEYRAMKHELRQAAFLCEELDRGNVCPACPKESGKIVLSFDALFGVPRKKSAGSSHRDPIHGSLLFGKQNEIDSYVTTYPMPKKIKKNCSDFKAGDAIRSASRYRALDETGVFGSACRHEFPKMFLNLKHGERLSYSVWMLQEILAETRGKAIDLYIMYDVACILQKHLKGTELSHLLEEIHLSIPAFHAYGHEASCQVLFSPLHCPGIGLSDGEVLERMWSFLRRFGKMTKEMRPSHRVDVLTHALLHYGHKTKQKLANLLVQRLKKAQHTLVVAEQSINQAMSAYAVSEADVQQWIEERFATVCSKRPASSRVTDWKVRYISILNSFYELREKIGAQPEVLSSDIDIHNELVRLEENLSEMEREHSITKRWEPSDFEYAETKCCVVKEKQEQLSVAMWTAVVRRQMLLRLKGKYADGQKVAKRISKQIGKETIKVKRLLEQFNACCSVLSSDDLEQVTLVSVLDPAGLFWTAHSNSKLDIQLSPLVPLSVKQDLISFWLQKQRSLEEIKMLKIEMLNVLEYFWMKGMRMKIKIQELLQTEQTDFVRGSISILFQRYTENEFILNHSIAVIQGFVDIPSSMLSASHNSESKCQSDVDDVLTDYDSDDSIISSDSDVEV